MNIQIKTRIMRMMPNAMPAHSPALSPPELLEEAAADEAPAGDAGINVAAAINGFFMFCPPIMIS